MNNSAILIPAAGFGRRMGGLDKLLQVVDGGSLLRRQASAALAAAPVVLVTIPSLDHPRARAVHDLPLTLVAVPDAAEGMAASLRTGVAAVPEDTEILLVVPGDMPDLGQDDFDRTINALRDTPDALIAQGTSADGTPGHPVGFRRALFPEFADLQGDRGAQPIVARHADRRVLVALPGRRALTDLDTPEAWAAWHAARSAP